MSTHNIQQHQADLDLTNIEEDRGKVQKHRPETLIRRREILETASQIFGKKGTSNATLEEIAEKVGMTRGRYSSSFWIEKSLVFSGFTV